MAKVNATQWLQRWGTGLTNNTQRIKDGVARVQTAPGQKAAAKAQKMLTGITQAITSGKWANNVGAVSLQAWQSSMSNKGVNNISTGVQQAQQTKQAKIQQMLDDTDAAVAAIASMPSDTADQRMARAMAYMQTRRQIAMQKGA